MDIVPCNPLISKLLLECEKRGITLREIARRAELTHGALGWYKRNERQPTRNTLTKLIRAFRTINLDTSPLEQLVNADIFWDRIISVEAQPYNGFVYDLTLNETTATGKMPHNFVAQGMFVGNCLGTLHSNSAREMLVRLSTEPMNVPTTLVHLLNMVIVLQKVQDYKEGMKRRVMQVAEVSHIDMNVLLSNVYERNPESDLVMRTDTPSHLMQVMSDVSGKNKQHIQQEINVREQILRWMLKHNVLDAEKVEKIIQQYYFDPASVLEHVNKDA